jgi:hypothetical protein
MAVLGVQPTVAALSVLRDSHTIHFIAEPEYEFEQHVVC